MQEVKLPRLQYVVFEMEQSFEAVSRSRYAWPTFPIRSFVPSLGKYRQTKRFPRRKASSQPWSGNWLALLSFPVSDSGLRSPRQSSKAPRAVRASWNPRILGSPTSIRKPASLWFRWWQAFRESKCSTFLVGHPIISCEYPISLVIFALVLNVLHCISRVSH